MCGSQIHPSICLNPLVPQYARWVIWSGAGFWAKTRSRQPRMCRFRSIRISMPSSRTSLASASSLSRPVLPPGRNMAFEFRREIIFPRSVAVADNVEVLPVMVLEDRLHEEADDVGAEIGREIGNPQSPVGRAVIEVRPRKRPQRIGKLGRPLAMLIKHVQRRGLRIKMHRITEIAVRLAVLAVELHRPPKRVDRLPDPAGLAEAASQHVPSH